MDAIIDKPSAGTETTKNALTELEGGMTLGSPSLTVAPPASIASGFVVPVETGWKHRRDTRTAARALGA